jgi:hypothetical protein
MQHSCQTLARSQDQSCFQHACQEPASPRTVPVKLEAPHKTKAIVLSLSFLINLTAASLGNTCFGNIMKTVVVLLLLGVVAAQVTLILYYLFCHCTVYSTPGSVGTGSASGVTGTRAQRSRTASYFVN